jgi:hypothetical protein
VRVGETFGPCVACRFVPRVEGGFPTSTRGRVRGILQLLHVILLLGCAAVIYLACEHFVNGVEWLGVRLGWAPWGSNGTAPLRP